MPDKGRVEDFEKTVNDFKNAFRQMIHMSDADSKIRGNIIIDCISIENNIDFIITLYFSINQYHDFFTVILTELNFSSKIKILKSLNLIDKQTYKELFRLNTIRNLVAHSPPIREDNKLNIINKRQKNIMGLEILHNEFNELLAKIHPKVKSALSTLVNKNRDI